MGVSPLYTPQLQNALAPCQLVWHEPKFCELKHAEFPPPVHSSTRSPPKAASECKNGRVAGFRRVLTRKTWAHARQAGMGPKHFDVVGYKEAGSLSH